MEEGRVGNGRGVGNGPWFNFVMGRREQEDDAACSPKKVLSSKNDPLSAPIRTFTQELNSSLIPPSTFPFFPSSPRLIPSNLHKFNVTQRLSQEILTYI